VHRVTTDRPPNDQRERRGVATTDARTQQGSDGYSPSTPRNGCATS
jgi:hypothetical protein